MHHMEEAEEVVEEVVEEVDVEEAEADDDVRLNN